MTGRDLDEYPAPSAITERDLLRGYGFLTPVPRSGERPVSVPALDGPDLQDAPETDDTEPDWPDPDIEYDRWRDQQLTDTPMA